MRFATKAIRIGQGSSEHGVSVTVPIYQTSTFAWDNLDAPPKLEYTRTGGPNTFLLEEVIAALENGKYAQVYASGMAAVTAAFSLLQQGDHFLMASDIYGGTYRLAYQWLNRQGISVSEFDASDPESISGLIQSNTKLAIFESPTNPNLKVFDVRTIANVFKKAGVISVFDNTFASPALQLPLDLGVDIVIHSTTKYLAGHSDLIGGALVTNSQNLYSQFNGYAKAAGACASPFDSWLLLRGAKTLSVRVKQHCENAQFVAEFLASHPRVKAVHYPGLKSHPQHDLAKSQMSGFGGMLAFEVDGTTEQAKKVACGTNIFLLAESLGGVESLIGYPPMMSHAQMTEEERLAKGIPPTLLRVSVGIEDKQDLVDDLEHALSTAFK